MDTMALRPVIALILGLFSITAFAAEINGFRVWTDPEKTRAVLDLSTRADYKLFTLDNPDRVVIDLNSFNLHARLNNDLDFDQDHSGVIKNVRHGVPDKNTLRVVLDLTGGSNIKSFMLEPTGTYGYRLVVDL